MFVTHDTTCFQGFLVHPCKTGKTLDLKKLEETHGKESVLDYFLSQASPHVVLIRTAVHVVM